MTKEEQALQYAKAESEILLQNAIMKAYLQGFDDGVASVKTQLNNDEKEDDIKWVDCGLPSGNLWGYKNRKKGAYPVNDDFVPSENDFEELFSCGFGYNMYSGFLNNIYVKTKKILYLESFYGFTADQFSMNLWVKSNIMEGSKRNTIQVEYKLSKDSADRVFVNGIIAHYEGNENYLLYCKHRG